MDISYKGKGSSPVKSVQEELQEVTARQKRLQLFGMLPISLCILAAVLMFTPWKGLGGGVAGVALLVYFLVVRREKGAYSDAVAAANLRGGLCADLSEARYTGKECLTLRELRELEILPVWEKSSLLIRQGFEARDRYCRYRGCETTFNYVRQENGKPKYLFLSGSLLLADQGRTTDQRADFLVLRRGLLEGEVQEDFPKEKGYRPLEAPDKLGEKYLIFGKGESLPDHWANRLSQLCQDRPTVAAVRVSPSACAVFLEGRFYTNTIPASFLPTAEQLGSNPLPERDGVWQLFKYWGAAGK